MASEWRTSTWGDEISLEYGKALRGYDRERGKYRVYGSNGPIGWTSKPLVDGPGVILGRKGAYRGVEYSPEPFFVIDTAYYVVPQTDLDLRWLYYAIRHYKLGEVDDGSPIPSTTRAAVYMLDVTVPPRLEQQAIAHVLGGLDDKIDLNARVSRTLDAMVRALFKSWFVDFDPVRAKLDGRWKRGESLPGLPAAIYDHVPERLVPSELGEIPEGWEVRPLSECIDAVRGLSYKGSGLSPDGLPMHNLNSIYEGGGYKHTGIKWYEGPYRPKHVARPGDVIVANTEQGHDRLLIAYAAIVPERLGAETLFSHHLYRVRPKPSCHFTSDYICQLLNTRIMQETISGYANGTTVNMLPLDALELPRVLVPCEPIVSTFTAIADVARKRREETVDELALLSGLRDTLLPKLISGELRIPDTGHAATGRR